MIGVMLSLCLLLVQQDPPSVPPPPPPPEELIAAFGKLPADQQQSVLRAVERRLQREPAEVVQRIVGSVQGMAAYPPKPEPTFFQPKEFAPVAAARQVLPAGSDRHRAGTAGIKPLLWLADLHCCVVYDWSIGKAVRVKDALTEAESFANMAHGYPPGTDQAVAQVLATIDDDPEQRRLAQYFEHLYADRDGRVFAGVSLFDAWYSGVQLEMPDVEAIAFARQFLKTQSFVSPIPADRRRERLYQQIKQAFADHREYRTLRLAAAAAHVAADPPLDVTYQPLLGRCHWLWAEVDQDPKAFAKWLRERKDRSGLLSDIDQRLRRDQDAIAQRDAAVQALRELALFVRTLAAAELQRAQAR